MKHKLSGLAMVLALTASLGVVSGSNAAMAATPHAHGSWSILAVPSPAGASGVTLSGISCPSRSMCIAVGGSSHGTLAEEWNGTAWSIQTTPGSASGDALSSVSCISASACEAVGSSAAGTLAEAWNGSNWTVQPAPTGGGASLASVWCTSATRCVAVGGNNAGPIADGWNGTHWSRQPGLPPPHPPSTRPVELSGVWCSSAHSCTSAGMSLDIPGPPLLLITTWNGKKWTWSQDVSNGGLLSGISCSAKVCVAVGQSASPLPQSSAPLSLINPGDNGGAVVLPPVPDGASDGTLNSVSCRSAICEAVGNTSLGTLAERWDGTAWALQPTPNPSQGTGVLAGIACRSATACLAVGDAGGAPLAEAYSG